MGARNRRVLAIAHTFAPASSVGVLRPLRILRHFAAQGWDTTILCVLPSTYRPGTPFDPALLANVPAGVDVVHAPVLRIAPAVARLVSPFRAGRRSESNPSAVAETGEPPRGAGQNRSFLQRSYQFVDELTTIPDKEAGWILPAIVRGLLVIASRRPDVMYSTAPPWSGQVVALALSKLAGVRWVADFRDPWARAPWREAQPARIRRASVTLERWVVQRADAILFATRTNRDEYASHYGTELARKFHIVSNGCDPAEFTSITGRPEADRFVVVHAGSLYGARSPVPVFRAVASALSKRAISRDNFRLRLIGEANSSVDLSRVAASMGIADIVELVPRMRRRDVCEAMMSASALLLLQPGTTVSVPGKLYEYFATGRPILALSEEGELSELVRGSGVGIAVSPTDQVAIESGLLRVIEMASGTLTRPPVDLYDGNRTAAEAVAIIAGVAYPRAVDDSRDGQRAAVI